MDLIPNQEEKQKVQVGTNLPLTALGSRLISLINSNNMEDYCKFKVGMTPESAIIEGNPIFLCYKKNPKETLNLISFIIIDFARSVNIGKNITNYQVDEIAYTIAIRFSDLRIEELFVILTNAKIGKYGKLYDRLDITIICDFIRYYLATERGDYFEKLNNSKSYKAIDTLEAIVKTEATDIPEVKELQKEIVNLMQTNLPKGEINPAYKTIYKLPSYNAYMEEVKKLIPRTKAEELLMIHTNALNHNFKELIQITIEEIEKRPANLIEQARRKISKNKKPLNNKTKSKIYKK